jgi:hypothetical protein
MTRVHPTIKNRKNHKDQGLKPTNLLSNNKIQNKIIQKNI